MHPKAFEIGYNPNLEVIDHSEVDLSCWPSTTEELSRLLLRIEAGVEFPGLEVPACGLYEAREMISILPKIAQWMVKPAAEANHRNRQQQYHDRMERGNALGRRFFYF